MARAARRYLANDPAGMIADMAAAVRLRDDDPGLWQLYATALSEIGQHAEAAEAWTRVIALDPDDEAALLARAIAYSDSRQLDAALADVTELLRRHPTMPDLLTHRAVVMIRMGDRAAAQQDLNTVLTDAPRDPLALLNRTSNFLALGHFADALADVRAAQETLPEVPWLLASACVARWRLRDPDALSECAKAVEIANADPTETTGAWPWSSRAGIAIAEGRPADAIGDLDPAISQHPRDGLSLYLRAIVRSRLGQDAAADLAAGLRYEPLVRVRAREYFGEAIGDLP